MSSIYLICGTRLIVISMTLARECWILQQIQAFIQCLWAIIEQPLETGCGRIDMTEKETEA